MTGVVEQLLSKCKALSSNPSTTKNKKPKTERKMNRDQWDILKHTNICLMEVPEEEKREKGAE
jgi:hypothetical protein